MSEKKGIFDRLDDRKQKVRQQEEQIQRSEQQTDLAQQALEQQQEIDHLEDKDMPVIESLNENSDYSVFMSKKVSAALRKQAFKKMFSLPSINVLDRLNDYDEDYTFFEGLGDIIPYHMQQELKAEAKAKLQQSQTPAQNEETPDQEQQITKESSGKVQQKKRVQNSEYQTTQNKHSGKTASNKSTK